MAGTLLPEGKQSFTTASGAPGVGYRLYTYIPGTSTPKATYTTSAAGVANANPVIADARGEMTVYWVGDYDVILKDASDVTIWGPERLNQPEALGTSAAGIAAHLVTLLTSAGSTLVGWIQAGTGAMLRTLSDRGRDTVHAFDFMTTAQITDVRANTAAVDVTSALQAAITAGGGRVILPAGTYFVSSALTMSVAGVTLQGAGYATNLRTNSASANIITVSAENCWINAIRFTSSVTRSGGWYVDFASGANRGRLSNFWMTGAIGGVRNAAAATVTIESGDILDSVAATGVGIRINAGFDVTIRDIIMDQAAQTFAGIYITATGDVTIEDCNIIRSGNALHLAPGAGQVVASVWASNSYFDTSSRGFFANPVGASASIVRCIFEECWFGGHTNQGVFFSTSGGGIVNGVDFNGCHFFGNVGDGMNIGDTGTTNVRVLGGAFAGNTGSGFSTGANVTDFSVQGARLGNSYGLGNNAYGIFITAGTGANFSLINNDVRGNTTAGISDGATGAGKVITGNLGYGYGSATYDPGSLADGAGVTTTVTVTGSVLGDKTWASFDKDLQGITLTAWVSTAGTVSVRFQNESGGVLDLVSGSLRAGIERIT